MKSAKNMFKLTAMAAAILASQVVMAQTTTMAQDGTLAPAPMITTESNLEAWNNSAAYIGAAIGRSRVHIDDSAAARQLTAPGQTVNAWSSDEKDVGFKLFAGKHINRYLAIEGGYFDMGDFSYSTSTVQGGTLTGDVRIRGVNADLIGKLPVSQRFMLFARAGMAYVKADTDFSGSRVNSAAPAEHNEGKWKPHFGVGAEMSLSQKLSLRLEAERVRTRDFLSDSGKADLYSLALVYKLGNPAPAPVYVAPPAPAPVEAAPAPAPVEAAPVPTSEKVSFAAEALFDFDKAIVKPEGKAALDDLLNKLQGMNTEVMVTVGHTDSIGSDAYNQKLSLRRAEAVKAYIVSKGVDQSRVYTEGKGETQPVADNGTSEGRSKNRRVTVEVVGTRTDTK
ncbi:OmpA family protein [Massilia sp. RP-1-19]|uniref:OmpA family protein n=1 Tax=Massilia polaris TaxID=2728846 RepID=A0A848HMZ9_9BURK|nr:OmpA family protein [Massilia polaris]NML62377.1 OmpA family protein [Massilia polaris]